MVNRMRNTSSKAKTRRSHHKVAEPTLAKDEKGIPHLMHRASHISGEYKGNKVIDVDKKIQKKLAKQAEQAQEEKEEEKK